MWGHLSQNTYRRSFLPLRRDYCPVRQHRIDCGRDAAIYAVFTLGGLHTTPDGRVLDYDGAPIHGLYAAGRTTSGVSAFGYASGVSLADGMLFGRLAGQSAAAD